MRAHISIAVAGTGVATLLSGVHAALYQDGSGDFHAALAYLLLGVLAVHVWLNRRAVLKRPAQPAGLARLGMVVAIIGVLLASVDPGPHLLAVATFIVLLVAHIWRYRHVMVRRVVMLGWKWAWIGSGTLALAHLIAE